MKSKIVTIIVGGIVTVTSLTICFLTEDKCEHAIQSAQFMNVDGTEEVAPHDWECRFIVEDYYTTDEGITIHYVHDVIENVDGSITFVGEDGLLTRIPYPYYKLEKNPKEK